MNSVKPTFISLLDLDMAVTELAPFIQVTFHNATQFEALKERTSKAFHITIEQLTLYFQQYTAIRKELAALKAESVQLDANPYSAYKMGMTQQEADSLQKKVDAHLKRRVEIPKRIEELADQDCALFNDITSKVMRNIEANFSPENQKSAWEAVAELGEQLWKQYGM
jgi:phosphoglycerate-specific signal transduction histidine kinase